MKQREKILLFVTMFAVAAYFGDQYGLIDQITNIVTMDNAQLTALQDQNNEYKDALDNIQEINAEFTRIGRVFAQSNEGDADAEGSRRSQFVEQLVQICKEVGQQRPVIEPAETEEIPDVSEYEYITAEIRIDDMKEADFYQFLRLMEENKIIVMRLDARNTQDRDQIRLNCKVARIQAGRVEAKLPSESEEASEGEG
jgi:hypothetical protein